MGLVIRVRLPSMVFFSLEIRIRNVHGYNVNELTDDENFNEITGNAGFGGMMVAIDRVDLAA